MPSADSEVAAQARLCGARLANTRADKLDELSTRGAQHSSVARLRYDGACLCYRAEHRRDAGLWPDPGFAALVLGFLAGADSAKPADEDAAAWQMRVSAHGRVVGDLFREWSIEGYKAQFEKRRKAFLEKFGSQLAADYVEF